MSSLGYKHTEEARARMSASHLGKPKSEDQRSKMIATWIGRKHTDESKSKMSAAHLGNGRGQDSYNWKGGRTISRGYAWISARDENDKLTRRPEHVLIAEKAIGRHMSPGEVVHHINGKKLDNRNSNLLVCAMGYHRWLEQHMANLYKAEHFA